MHSLKWFFSILIITTLIACGEGDDPTGPGTASSSGLGMSSNTGSSSSETQGSSSNPLSSAISSGTSSAISSGTSSAISSGTSSAVSSGTSSAISSSPVSSGTSSATSSSQVNPPSSSQDWVVLNLAGDSGVYTDERDGNEYRWTRVGNQIWMAQNLRYNDNGNMGESEGVYYSTSRYAPDYDWTGDGDVNGYYYNWATAMGLPQSYITEKYSNDEFSTQGICPEGWHIPTSTEAYQLGEYIANATGETAEDEDGFLNIADFMRTTSGWNLGAHGTDQFGLSMVPSGWGMAASAGEVPSFANSSVEATFWVAGEYWGYVGYRWLLELHREVTAFYKSSEYKYWVISIRCLANQ